MKMLPIVLRTLSNSDDQPRLFCLGTNVVGTKVTWLCPLESF